MHQLWASLTRSATHLSALTSSSNPAAAARPVSPSRSRTIHLFDPHRPEGEGVPAGRRLGWASSLTGADPPALEEPPWNMLYMGRGVDRFQEPLFAHRHRLGRALSGTR